MPTRMPSISRINIISWCIFSKLSSILVLYRFSQDLAIHKKKTFFAYHSRSFIAYNRRNREVIVNYVAKNREDP